MNLRFVVVAFANSGCLITVAGSGMIASASQCLF